MKKRFYFFVGLLLFFFFPVNWAAAQTTVPAVQAILFYSPTCPHCHAVINDLLVPMQEQYGDQLQILGVDVTQPAGSMLFVESLTYFGWVPEETGVPTLIVADTVLNGSLEIPEKFPGIVQAGLAAGGIGWPEIPGLQEMVPDLPPSAAPQPITETAPAAEMATDEETAVSGIQTGVNSDMANSSHPVDGAWLAWLVMALMVTAVIFTGFQAMTARNITLKTPSTNQTINFVLLVIIGLGVAGYLAYIETTETLAVCGPVGDCNTVQTSPYATILGIPVAILGLVNYLAVGLLWFVQGRVQTEQRQMVWLGMMALAFVGTIFSIYLTALELFVIRAVCAWCLTSAVVTALLLLLVNGLVEKREVVRAV
ncbi:MAG: vitamin K epoxide reductase [Ardenticatenaceae bacterium]|nr:vitamin K epoxide reductase [Ardenticatenaceae bacterium]MCB9446191.1 vitamin K epoxide reductase [Ardenticatenaceae bacterium]